MNSGERDELIIKLVLIDMRDKHISWKNMSITSVGFDAVEYKDLPNDFSFKKLEGDDNYLINVCKYVGVQKAGVNDKADVYINKIGYSLKSLSAAPPALVNHTNRAGFEVACKHANIDIKDLDVLIKNYWKLRVAGEIMEDVTNGNPKSPFACHKDVIGPVLSYFLFEGSGKGLSPHKADYILDYRNPIDSTTWHKYSPDDAVDLLWTRLVFSMRSKKGMPTNYNPITFCGKNADSIKQWVVTMNGSHKGALHIRVK